MKKYISILLLLFISVVNAQDVDTKNEDNTIIIQNIEKNNLALKKVSQSINILKETIVDLELTVTNQENKIDSLTQLIQVNGQNIITNSNQLGTEIKEVSTSANTQISALDDTIVENRLYWIIACLSIVLLGFLMYLFLGKRIKSSKTDVETQLRNTKTSLDEESVKLDRKLMDILETQLKVKQEESNKGPDSSNKKEDHSLALKVADEIVRMQKNLTRMDESTKGLKQLNSSVQRIQDNFSANGYEVVEMLGKEYNEGMKVTANFIPNEDVAKGKQIITRIIKPQVNYKNEMIQAAQIEVSVGE